MTDIKTILVTESAIADISSELEFMVSDGPSQKTFQAFSANTASNQQINFNIQIPSQEIVTVRSPTISTDLKLTLTITGVPVGKTGSQIFQYGLTDAFQSFPLNSLFNVSSGQINNTSVSSNIRQIKDLLMRFYDMRKLGSYQSTSPVKIDSAFANFADAIGANNNPLSDYSVGSLDQDFVPRGAYPLSDLQVWYVPASTGIPAQQVYGTNTLTSASTSDKWYVFVTATVTEPILGLSPLSSLEGFESNKAGFYGLNTLNLNFTIDTTCSRVWSSGSGYITNIQLGYVPNGTGVTAVTSGFNNTLLNVEFMSPTPAQVAKLSTSKNVLPFYDYSYYTSNFNGTQILSAGQSTTVVMPSIQLSNIPDYLVIAVRKQMSSQNWNDSASFFTINSVTINFNNASGLISSASQTQLFELSKKNNSNQNYYEWRGKASQLYSPANGSGATAGKVLTIPTTGSVLIVSPNDLSLPMWASASSLGQYNLLVTLNVTCNYGTNVPLEGIIMTPSSGVFETQQGTSSAFIGVLTKEAVLKAKESESSVIGTAEWKRLVGGRGLPAMGVSGIKHHLKHHLARKLHHGGAGSGGSMSGGLGIEGHPVAHEIANRVRNRMASRQMM
jgi:hypothetical protein